MGRMRSNESQSILKYTLLQERNSPGIGLRLDIGCAVLCRAQTHSVVRNQVFIVLLSLQCVQLRGC